ncbi:MAG: alpha/beta hydrolase [Nevskiales bacterium]
MLRKTLLWSAGLLALAYAGAAIFLDLQQRSLLYFPQGTHVAPEQTDYALQRDGVTLRGWVMNPGQARALIYFGGNGDAVQKMREDYARWGAGRTVYLVAYRGYGASDGTPTEAALFGDALAIYDDVRTRQREIAVVGRSLGSGVATYLASQRPVERLALVTPFDSIARIAQGRFPIFPAQLILKDKYESWRYAPQVRCPVLVLEAQNDSVVPAASTARLLEKFTPAPKFLRIDHVGHGNIIRDPVYAAAITDFLR